MIDDNKIPHAILFTGPSGCGKTTLARILRQKLDCSRHDFTEVNCADFRGIDMVREIRTRMGRVPIMGKSRIWLIDEAHQLSGDAQNAFLKMLEDTPNHVYFMLATTDPHKLKKTVVTRCTEIRVEPLARSDMNSLITDISKREKIKLTEEVVAKLTEVADGSARKALVLLHSIAGLTDESSQLSAILNSDSKRQAIEIARALFNRTAWSDMAKILKGVDEEPESLRHLILGYATTILLSPNVKMHSRANLVIDCFRDHWYDSKRAGLISSCYEVLTAKR